MADYTKELKIAELIVRQEWQEWSAQDQELLNQWLKESKEHAQLYQKLLQNPDATRAVPEFETEKFVRATVQKIQQRKIRILTVRIASVAAILCIGIFSAFFFRKAMPEKSSPDSAVVAERTQAVLSLPDGRQIGLGDETKEEEQGTAWMKYAGGHNQKTGSTSGTADMKIEVSRGSEYKVRLADGSVVWLNSESSLVYPGTFSGKKRVVQLTGEAYFEVTRDETKPFIVSVGGVEIKVLGTSFNVTAYQDEGTVATTLVEGSVEVATSHESVRLVPGNRAVIEEGKTGIAVSDVDPALYAPWTSGIFKFDKMTLADICKRLTRWYDVDFVFEDDCGYEKFTGGTWKYIPLQDFLSKIEQVTDVTFQIEKGTVVVSHKK